MYLLEVGNEMASEFEAEIIDSGFESEKEFFKMVSSVNLHACGVEKFNEWKLNDGTKEGLEKLINV